MKLNPIFHSHMVFAAHQPIRFYGEGAGTAEITFAGQTQTVESAGGFWLAEFPPMGKGGPYTAEILLNGTPVTLTDVYLGDVTLVRLVQPKNAASPMLVTLFPIVTLVRLSQ